MTTPVSPSAKDKVLAWVRSKNPQTMELKFGCEIYRGDNSVKEFYVGQCSGKVAIVRSNKFGTWLPFEVEMELSEKWTILGSDMGLQELLIALTTPEPDSEEAGMKLDHEIVNIVRGAMGFRGYNLTKNLHEQSDDFYESILPLCNAN